LVLQVLDDSAGELLPSGGGEAIGSNIDS